MPGPGSRHDDERLSGLDASIVGDLDPADHLCRSVGRLWNAGRDAGDHRPHGRFGVERVTLPVVGPFASVATVALDAPEPLSAHELTKSTL